MNLIFIIFFQNQKFTCIWIGDRGLFYSRNLPRTKLIRLTAALIKIQNKINDYHSILHRRITDNENNAHSKPRLGFTEPTLDWVL